MKLIYHTKQMLSIVHKLCGIGVLGYVLFNEMLLNQSIKSSVVPLSM